MFHHLFTAFFVSLFDKLYSFNNSSSHLLLSQKVLSSLCKVPSFEFSLMNFLCNCLYIIYQIFQCLYITKSITINLIQLLLQCTIFRIWKRIHLSEIMMFNLHIFIKTKDIVCCNFINYFCRCQSINLFFKDVL